MAAAFRGKIAITGVAELDKQLELIAADDGPKSVNYAMRKVLRAAIKEIIEPEVLANVPVAKGAYWRPTSTRVAGREAGTFGDGSHTLAEPGFLRSKITVRARRRSRTSIGFTCGFNDELFKGDTYYAGFLEYGTKQRTTKHGANRGRITMDSFLRVPLYSNASRVVEFARNGVREFCDARNREG